LKSAVVLGRLFLVGQWLNFELSSTVLFFFVWMWATSIIAAVIAALIFTHYMLKILFEEKNMVG